MDELIKIFHYLRIPGIIWGIVVLIWKIAPVSNLTADIVEVKLFSKEKRLLVKGVKYIFYSLLATAFLYVFVEFIINRWDSIPLPLVSLLMIVNFILFCILIIVSTFISFRYSQTKRLVKNIKVRWFKKGIYSMQKLSIIKRLLIFLLYILITYISFSSFLSYTIIESGLYLGIRNGIATDILAVLIFVLLCSLFIPVLIRPGLSFINWNTKQIAYIKDKNETWYILYPTQKNYVLLGNNMEESLCTKKKLVQKEDLINKVINIE